jgi:hypothetical protein
VPTGFVYTEQDERAVLTSSWRDIGQFYHAGLRNLAGPFTRACGIDMLHYINLTGLWIWEAIGRDLAPFSMPDQPEIRTGAGLHAGTVLRGTRHADSRRRDTTLQGLSGKVTQGTADQPVALMTTMWCGIATCPIRPGDRPPGKRCLRPFHNPKRVQTYVLTKVLRYASSTIFNPRARPNSANGSLRSP